MREFMRPNAALGALCAHKESSSFFFPKQTVRLLFIVSERSRVHVSAAGEEEEEESRYAPFS